MNGGSVRRASAKVLAACGIVCGVVAGSVRSRKTTEIVVVGSPMTALDAQPLVFETAGTASG